MSLFPPSLRLKEPQAKPASVIPPERLKEILRSRYTLELSGSLAPHTSGPRDVPRVGLEVYFKKTPHYRGDTAESAVG